VGKNGVVRDPAVHLRVLRQFLTQAHESRFTVRGITFSPIRGPEGNIEYLGWLAAEPGEDRIPDLAELVRASHQTLERMT
jgi:23S rRNA (cytidine1920-2'-O)/16S rRNA (cytidine1409-2'-O)-methyltransferase